MRRNSSPTSVLYELFPSRWDDDPVSRARMVFAGLAGIRDIAMERTATQSGLRFYVRAVDSAAAAAVLGQVRAAYPQAAFGEGAVGSTAPLDPPHLTAARAAKGKLRRNGKMRGRVPSPAPVP